MRAGRRPWITLMLREFVTHEIAVTCCQCFVICRTPAKRSRRNHPKSHEAIPRSLGSTDHRQPVQSGSSSTKKKHKVLNSNEATISLPTIGRKACAMWPGDFGISSGTCPFCTDQKIASKRMNEVQWTILGWTQRCLKKRWRSRSKCQLIAPVNLLRNIKRTQKSTDANRKTVR